MTNKQLQTLVRATLRIYWVSAKEAVLGSLKVWWAPLMPIAYGVILQLVGKIVSPLGLVGGFIVGLSACFLLAHFYVHIRAAVGNEKVSFQSGFEQAKELFRPMISVLFLLWIATFVIGYLFDLGSRDAFPIWLAIAMNLILVVLFNPLPEVVVFGGQSEVPAFTASLEFMRENAIEWLLPTVLILLCVTSASGLMMLTYFQEFGLFNFFYLIPLFAVLVLKSPVLVVPITFFLVGVFLLLVFRGALFLKLSRSTRRKRMYQFDLN